MSRYQAAITFASSLYVVASDAFGLIINLRHFEMMRQSRTTELI